ncbi:MAG: TIGR04283 family arsenosugar biosynthesis glycosyltransferase [Proteobacteria bacterium]|nr:TIGR04283 family arsenosugar biosynthesis glycosyltransferase [Pseudomonadota bacterium]
MLSVVIPTFNAASTLGATLDSLQSQLVGVDYEVVVADGASSDASCAIAEAKGVKLISVARGRGAQLAAGGDAARGDWLLFLHADTILGENWRIEAEAFMAVAESAEHAGVFRLRFNDRAPAARRLETIAAWRSRALGLPYGDQGLLIGRGFYDVVGGFRPLLLMEDVDIARRIGRRRFVHFGAAAFTSAERYRRSGYIRRSARNLVCLTLFFLGVKSSFLVRLYG